MELKQKVVSGLGWSASTRFLGQLITWGITIVVIRLLSPADYGLMAMAGVFVDFLAALNELGLGAAVVQRKEIDNNTLKSLYGWVLIASLSFYLTLAASAPIIAAYYDEPRLVLLIRVLALQFLLLGFTVLPQSLLLRNMEFRTIASVDFIAAIAGSFATLAFALSGFGVWALVWGSVIIRFVSMVGLNLVQPFLCIPQLNIKGMRTLFSFGGYVTGSRILWYLYSRADTLIIGKILGKELLGFYTVGMYLASLPMEKVSGIINQVAFPAFSSVQSEPNLLGRHFLKAVRVMSICAFPVLWGMSSIGSEIVAIFLGPKWIDASLPLQIIALIIPVRMISNIMAPAVLGAGRADVLFFNTLVGFILMPTGFLLGSSYGLLGVSIAWVMIFPLVFCINLSRIIKILQINSKDVFLSMLMPIICCTIMYCFIQIIKSAPIMSIALVPKVILLVVLGAGSYFLMTLLFNSKGLKEVRELVKV